MVAATLCFSTAVSQTVLAQSANAVATRQFNIPAQPLSNALNQFGRQSGLQVVVPAEVAQGVNSRSVVGAFTSSQALAQLLQGTGISHRITPQGTAVIGGQQAATTGSAATVEGAIALDTIDVSGGTNAASGSGYQGTPDWVYETPASVSVVSREAIVASPARNTRDLLDSVAGVYVNRSDAQNPGIIVNVRGLQDQDRIATMIDGARQTFQRAGHGSSQQVYVDSSFLRDIEIEKSSTSRVGSLGTLGGSVNFRTINSDDLIKEGRDWGVEINTTTGTNAYNFAGSIAGAYRLTDSISILGGVSYKDIGAFEIGRNGSVMNSGTYDGDILRFSGQKIASSLLKAEVKFTPDMSLVLGWVRNDSDFDTGASGSLFNNNGVSQSQENVINNTYTARFAWKPPSDLIDFKANLWLNRLSNTALDVSPVTGIGAVPSNYEMASFGGSIENTSTFRLPSGTLAFNYGAEAFKDDAKTSGSYVVGGVDYSDLLTGATPSGSRSVASGFANATWKHDDWLTVSGGLRYDHYDIAGTTTVFGNSSTIYHPPSNCLFPVGNDCLVWGTPGWYEYLGPQAHEVKVDQSEGALLPTATVAVQATKWLQPFVRYAKSFRPPTVMESFINGGHGATNGYAPNPYLQPERADTWEIGANISQNGLFKPDDSLRLKVVGFQRDIEDYIIMARTRLAMTDRTYDTFVNLDGITRMKGVEIEANYDARSWYIGGALTWINTKFGESYTITEIDGSTVSVPTSSFVSSPVLFVQPDLKVTLDGGVRLFDEKLTLGARMNYVGETKATIGSLLPESTFSMSKYTTFDLYGSYAFSDTAKLRLNVTNLTDLAYVSAMGASYYAAPGRTATVGLQIKF